MPRTVDTLFVAMTRPEMKWGVTWDGILVNIGITFFVTTLIIHRPWAFLIGIGIHLGMKELCRVDPHFFHKWRKFVNTKGRSITGAVWGGSRLQPSRTKIKKAAEIRSGV